MKVYVTAEQFAWFQVAMLKLEDDITWRQKIMAMATDASVANMDAMLDPDRAPRRTTVRDSRTYHVHGGGKKEIAKRLAKTHEIQRAESHD